MKGDFTMKIKYTVLGPFMTNTYIVYDENTKEGLVIDPSFTPEYYIQTILDDKIILKSIFLTHAHVDHMAGMNTLRNRFPDAELYMSRGDESYLKDPAKNLSYEFPDSVIVEEPEHWIKGGEHIKTCGLDFTVIDTPGHTPGGLSFYEEKEQIVFTGDSLFQGSIGRTDFPGGSMTQLVEGIRRNLFCLPDDVVVLSGHGNPTSIGQEKKTNPFLTGGIL